MAVGFASGLLGNRIDVGIGDGIAVITGVLVDFAVGCLVDWVAVPISDVPHAAATIMARKRMEVDNRGLIFNLEF